MQDYISRGKIYWRGMRSEPIARRVASVLSRIEAACHRAGRSPSDVTLVAVCKGFPPEAVLEAAAAGVTHFAENRVQEAAAKRPHLSGLPAGITWHMVGHLQTNKVKSALELFDIIHSVDSLRLADAVSRRAPRRVPVFLEVNVAAEPTKHGFNLEELPAAYEAAARMPNLDIWGLMTVAPLARDPEDVRPIFRRLHQEARALGLRQLSMGMTDDFEVAIEEGATHVRIGRAIFGDRPV